MQLVTLFLTGLVSGGLMCAFVQSGLLLSLLAAVKSDGPATRIRAAVIFLGAKLLVYSLLGLVLGAVGSRLTVSPTFFGGLQLVASIYMLGVVGALLEIHPVFRRFFIQPPKWAGKIARNQARRGTMMAAAILGFVTVLLPCGTTQAVISQALLASNPITGLLMMFVYTLGTIPLFLGLSLGLVVLDAGLQKHFTRVVSVIIGGLALITLNGGLILVGSPVYPSLYIKQLYCGVSFCPIDTFVTDKIAISITRDGYSVDHSTIKTGSTVLLTLENTNASGCQQAFTIPSLGISKIVEIGKTEKLTFKAPTTSGTLAYSCSMGMYSGEFQVIN